jgi:hypothetical protein
VSAPSAMVIGVDAQRGLSAALRRRHEKAAQCFEGPCKGTSPFCEVQATERFLTALFFLQSERAIKEHWKSMG